MRKNHLFIHLFIFSLALCYIWSSHFSYSNVQLIQNSEEDVKIGPDDLEGEADIYQDPFISEMTNELNGCSLEDGFPTQMVLSLNTDMRESAYQDIKNRELIIFGKQTTCDKICKTSELTKSELRKDSKSCKVIQSTCQAECSLLPWDKDIEYTEMNDRFMKIIETQGQSYENTKKVNTFKGAKYIAPCIAAGVENYKLNPIRTHSAFCTSKSYSTAVGIGQITRTTFYSNFGISKDDYKNGCGALKLKDIESFKSSEDQKSLPITLDSASTYNCSIDKNNIQVGIYLAEKEDRAVYENLTVSELYDRLVFDVRLQLLSMFAVLENTPGTSLTSTVKNYGTGTTEYFNKFNKCYSCMNDPNTRWQYGMQTWTEKGKKISGPGWGCKKL